MASSKASVEVILLLSLAMAFLAIAAAANSPVAAPAASEDCTVVVTELIDCLPFVTGTVSKPPATCCSNLTAIIQDAPTCLCQLYNTTFTEPLGLNVTRAQQLPPACKVSTPNPSLCTLLGIPVAAPVPVTSAAPTPSAPGVAPTPSGVARPSSNPVASPVVQVTAPSTAVPSSKNETTVSPSGSPSGASITVCSFSAVALLLVHLIVHL